MLCTEIGLTRDVFTGGAEYAERVHKLGASMLQWLLPLHQLSHAVERHAEPLRGLTRRVVCCVVLLLLCVCVCDMLLFL